MWALNGTQGRAHKEACGEEHVWHCAPYLLGKSKQEMRLAGSSLLVFMVCVCRGVAKEQGGG